MTTTHALKNAPLKIVSLMLGYGFWHLFGSTHLITSWHTIPLTFYNTTNSFSIDAPETVYVQLKGTRTHISYLDEKNLAIHIDGNTLNIGNNCLDITNHDLLLPASIKMIDYRPTNIIVRVSHATSTQH